MTDFLTISSSIHIDEHRGYRARENDGHLINTGVTVHVKAMAIWWPTV